MATRKQATVSIILALPFRFIKDGEKKMRPIYTLLVLFISLSGVAQDVNYRKAILKSDFIFVSNNYSSDLIQVNDYTNVSQIKINSIDTVLKNKLPSLPQNITLRSFRDSDDFYSELVTNNGGCVMEMKVYDDGASYQTIFFVKKVGKEYQAFLVLHDLKWIKYEQIVRQITTSAFIENTKTDKERLEKTIDWFIGNGVMPDEDFVAFYKNKGIITDSIHYSEIQYQWALTQFEKGNEALLPIVKIKYKDQVKDYFVQRMEAIFSKQEHDFNDYYDFSGVVYSATDNFSDSYESANYILNGLLTSDKMEEYDKRKVMELLIIAVKEWE